MANPGYPNMPGQMPMGGPQMGGPQMGGPPHMMGGPPMGGPRQMMRPGRRGTSKAVPVVVSAGLAVGVFCGLLFGVGTGKEAGANAPTASNVKKVSDEDAKVDPGAAPKGLGATSAKPVDAPKTGSGATPAVAAGAGSAAPTGAGAGSAAKPVAAVEKKVIKVKLVVKPEGAMTDAKVKIDGKEIDGLVADLPPDTKSFKVEIKASGYRTYSNKFNTMPDTAEMSVELELTKRPAAGTGTRPPKRPTSAPSAGGGGLIDI